MILSREAKDAPCWYSSEEAYAWADGFNTASDQLAAGLMWDKFIDLLEERQPIRGDKKGETKPHVNFLGSVEAYRKVFMEANSERYRNQP
jgi:hypothetical protein